MEKNEVKNFELNRAQKSKIAKQKKKNLKKIKEAYRLMPNAKFNVTINYEGSED